MRRYGEEVAWAAQVQFGTEDGCLDLERVAAFAAGYSSVIPISDGDRPLRSNGCGASG